MREKRKKKRFLFPFAYASFFSHTKYALRTPLFALILVFFPLSFTRVFALSSRDLESRDLRDLKRAILPSCTRFFHPLSSCILFFFLAYASFQHFRHVLRRSLTDKIL
jgi:hypothetical protein